MDKEIGDNFDKLREDVKREYHEKSEKQMEDKIVGQIREYGLKVREVGQIIECTHCGSEEYSLVFDPQSSVLYTICDGCNFFLTAHLNVNSKVGGPPSWNNIAINMLEKEKK